MASQFSKELRRLRLKAGFTQEQLAERSGVSVRTLRGLETGDRKDPRAVTVGLLADALGLRPDEQEALLTAAAAGQARLEHATLEQRRQAEQPKSALQNMLDEAAEQLAYAVRGRWQREETLRKIHDPFPLPVRWQSAAEGIADHWYNILGTPAESTSEPPDLAGRLDEIVRVYDWIPSGRLVVLGRPGSGKTILMARFVLDSLKFWGPGDPVPVIFGLGSWNPTAVTLRDWLTRQLEHDYPGLAAPGPRSTLAAALVHAGRVLPVLDGFDEIAEDLRWAALVAINNTTMPLVLTSRSDEYRAAMRTTGVLTAAAVIELTGIAPIDLVDYLSRTFRRTTLWDPILAELHDPPTSRAGANLTRALVTPLMVALARTTYGDTPGRDPSVLLDTDRFPTAKTIEDHLVGAFSSSTHRDQAGRAHMLPAEQTPIGSHIADPLATATAPVTIYLSDESTHQQVEAAVENFLALAGAEVEDREEPVLGSWFRRIRAKFAAAARSPLAREAMISALHAADARVVHAQDATTTEALLHHLAPVITALQPTKEAVIRAGALLIVKVDEKVVVYQLTAAQQLQLDHQPTLAASPHDILTVLQLEANGAVDPADRPNHPIDQSATTQFPTQARMPGPFQPPSINH